MYRIEALLEKKNKNFPMARLHVETHKIRKTCAERIARTVCKRNRLRAVLSISRVLRVLCVLRVLLVLLVLPGSCLAMRDAKCVRERGATVAGHGMRYTVAEHELQRWRNSGDKALRTWAWA